MLTPARGAETEAAHGAGNIDPVSARAPRFRTLCEALEYHVRQTPEAPALAAEATVWSYAKLGQRARVLAATLTRHGVRRGQRVAVMTAKSCEAVSALYAILGLGAAYVPLSEDWPAERVRWIGHDVAPAAWLVDAAHRDSIAPLGVPVIVLEQVLEDGIEVGDLLGAAPDDLAYIIYTSGSTGDPKGVMHSHRSAFAFVGWVVNELGLTAQDRFASHAPFHFDLSILDLYAASRVGATLVLPAPALAQVPSRYVKWLLERRITVSYTVPGVWVGGLANGLPAEAAASSLRRIIYAGEAMAPKHAAAVQAAFPNAELYNFYGPTETNVCTSFKLPRLDAAELPEQIPIGTACSGDRVELEDGELVVHGPSLLVGYWGKPARALGAPYRTGDLARWDDRLGGYVFLGRRDGMRKLRGYRVELGEVEACLLRHPATAEVVVTLDERDADHPVLVAFVVPAPAEAQDSMALKRHCARFLPPYMVPRIQWRESLPRTTTGKVDRRRLELDGSEMLQRS